MHTSEMLVNRIYLILGRTLDFAWSFVGVGVKQSCARACGTEVITSVRAVRQRMCAFVSTIAASTITRQHHPAD